MEFLPHPLLTAPVTWTLMFGVGLRENLLWGGGGLLGFFTSCSYRNEVLLYSPESCVLGVGDLISLPPVLASVQTLFLSLVFSVCVW